MSPPTKHCAVCGVLFEKRPSDSRRTWEKRKCCTYKCSVEIRRGRPNPKAAYWKGKTQPLETRAKRSVSAKRAHAEGRMHVIDNTGLRGEETSQWKGDDISYRTAHTRLYSHRGRPTECELCGTTIGPFEWALRQDAVVCRVQEGGIFDGKSFSTELDDYMPACRPCHRDYDGRERDPRTGRYL